VPSIDYGLLVENPLSSQLALILFPFSHHTPQLPLARKLLAQVLEVAKKLLANLDKGLLWRDCSVGLATDEELRDIRVGNCNAESARPSMMPFLRRKTGQWRPTLVSSHQDVLMLHEVLRYQVANSVVLLLDDKVGTIWHS